MSDLSIRQAPLVVGGGPVKNEVTAFLIARSGLEKAAVEFRSNRNSGCYDNGAAEVW